MQEKVFLRIDEKYKSLRFKINDSPSLGKKVVYIPDYNSFMYLLYGDYYKNYKYEPGDIFTVKWNEEDSQCNSVYVDENECIFSPAELVPAEYVEEDDIKLMKKTYQQKLQEKLENEKKE